MFHHSVSNTVTILFPGLLHHYPVDATTTTVLQATRLHYSCLDAVTALCSQQRCTTLLATVSHSSLAGSAHVIDPLWKCRALSPGVGALQVAYRATVSRQCELHEAKLAPKNDTQIM